MSFTFQHHNKFFIKVVTIEAGISVTSSAYHSTNFAGMKEASIFTQHAATQFTKIPVP
jgi:hypothetical protein